MIITVRVDKQLDSIDHPNVSTSQLDITEDTNGRATFEMIKYHLSHYCKVTIERK